MIKEFNENGHPMVFSDSSVNTEQLKEKCANAIKSLSGVHGVAERKAEACFKIALSELENNWKQRAEAAEAKLAELEKQEPVGYTYDRGINCQIVGAVLEDECPCGVDLFARPAPAVSLAELVPEGWKLVPVKPTGKMVIEGFVSDPDISGDSCDLQAYESMRGCEQAAHRARLCWAAMLAAAPEVE